MSHKPVIGQQSIGVLGGGFTIQRNTVGVVYQGQRFLRLLGPGEQPSRSTTVYVVDVKPHESIWKVQLPTQHDQDCFIVESKLVWRVTDAKRMVDEEVEDTERLIARTLEPILRRKARQYNLSQHKEAEDALKQTIAEADLPGLCGLELTKSPEPEVSIHLTDADHRRIKEIRAQARALHGPITAEHTDEAPSSEPAYKFRVHVVVTYRVVDREALPSDSPSEAETLLWPKMQRILKRRSRKFSVDGLGPAEEDMQQALDEELDHGSLDGFGLTIVSVGVTADLDEASRQRYVELAEVDHQVALEDAKRKGLERNMSFYLGLIEQGYLAVVAMAVSKDEISFDELAQRLSEADRTRFERQMALLEKLRSDDVRDERHDQDIEKGLMNNLAGEVMGARRPALPKPGGTTAEDGARR